MKLVHNWKRIALRAHSMRAFILSLVALIMPEVMFFVFERDLASPRFWWGVGVGLLVYGIVGRLVDQKIGDEK